MKKDAVAYLVTRKRGDIEHQKEILEEFCKYRFNINQFFNDHRISSTPFRKRDGYNQMLEYCRENGIKFILFISLPALSRNPDATIEEMKLLVGEEFIPFFAKGDFIGYYDDPAIRAEAIVDFISYMEAYLEGLKKVQPPHPRQEAQLRGTIGRPRALNEGQIEALITVRRSGTSISQICRMFNVSRSTVSKILTDHPELKGEWKGKRQSAEQAESE